MANDDEVGWDAVLGARLKQLRLEQDRSQSEVAKVADVSQPTISNWERGGAGGPDEGQLRKIETFLKRSLDDGSVTDDGELATDLARWLKRAIADKQQTQNLNMSEIALAAGVSVPTIYNILNGAVAAPQERTLKRLQEYFGTVPEEVKAETEAAQDLGALGKFTQFEPHERAAWPADPGVYVLYDITGRPVYIGKSKNSVAARISDHQTRFWFRKPLVTKAAYISVKDPKLVRDLETLLIKVLGNLAVMNEKGVIRDEE